MDRPEHLKELEQQLLVLTSSPGYNYEQKGRMPCDGGGVYMFTTSDGRCAYVGITRKERDWADRVNFHFRGPSDSTLFKAIVTECGDATRALSIIRTMTARGIPLPSINERLELERFAKVWLRPLYSRD